MWRFLASALLAAVQEDADAWLDRLGADDPAEREAATRWLLENGEQVRDRLEALAAGEEPERAARARGILDELDRRRELRQRVQLYPPVTLEARDEPVAEVLARIRDETGFPLARTRIPADARVNVSLQRAPVLQAIWEVARQSGLSFGGGWRRASVQPGIPALTALSDDGLVALTWTGLRQSRYASSGASTPTATLNFLVVWGCRVAPASVRIELDRVESSAGPLPLATQSRIHRGWPLVENTAPLQHERVELEPPIPRDLEWISLSGRAVVRFALEEEQFEFPWDGRVHSVSYTLPDETRLTLERGEEERMEDWLQVRFDPPLSRARASELRATATDSRGRVYCGWESGTSRGPGELRGLWFSFDDAPDVATVTVTVPTRAYEVLIPFRLERVPLGTGD